MWICKKCTEENEDSFDSCWKCQAHSEIGSEKSKVQQQVVKEEEEKKDTLIKEEEKLEEGVKKYQPILLIVSIIVLVFSFLFLPGLLTPIIGRVFMFPLVFVPSIIVYNLLKSYFTKKQLKNKG